MVTIDVANVLRQFDDLLSEGELFYTPTEPIPVTDQDLHFTFRIVSSYKSKPQSKTSLATSKHRPPPSDGSDIDHSDPAFFVAHINGTSPTASPTHKLILNKFCAFRPQYILLTTDPLQRQSSPLDEADLSAAWAVLTGLSTRHYVIFNGGKQAGSSRVHKHLQVLEEPAELSANIVPTCTLPYKHFLQSITGAMSGAELYEVYKEHFAGVKAALGITEDDGETQVAHNIILTKDWLLTVPRRSATLDGLAGNYVNAAAMVGQSWLNNEDQLRAWKDFGPRRALAELGVPLER